MPPRDLNPRWWGPDMWRTMHRLCYAYPEAPTDAERAAAHAYFASLCHLLPCAKCRRHYTKHFETTFAPTVGTSDDPTASRRQLTAWMDDFHARVDARLGKSRDTDTSNPRAPGAAARPESNDTAAPSVELGALQATHDTSVAVDQVAESTAAAQRTAVLWAAGTATLLVVLGVVAGVSVALARQSEDAQRRRIRAP